MADLWRRIRFAFWAAVYARTGWLRAARGMSNATEWELYAADPGADGPFKCLRELEELDDG